MKEIMMRVEVDDDLPKKKWDVKRRTHLRERDGAMGNAASIVEVTRIDSKIRGGRR